jgi:gentisate 1,2-dioxygenase
MHRVADSADGAETGRQAFYERAQAQHLAPLWQVIQGLVPREPRSPAAPALWSFAAARPYLMEAAALIGTEEAERRVLVLENPALPGESRITRSLYAGLQIVMPGEIAPAHRHAAAALRLVLESAGGYTSVEGERTAMSPGDFVVTPSWTWHDHGNLGAAPVIWLDVLDVHLVNLLDSSFREEHTERTQQIAPSARASPFNYPYTAMRAALEDSARSRKPDPAFGFKRRYVNPVSGDWAIPTIATWAQLLPRGFRTSPYRSTDGTIFAVIEGSGRSHIGSHSFEWRKHDVFVVPSWCESAHEASESSVLFGASDRVVQEKLGLWREDPPSS